MPTKRDKTTGLPLPTPVTPATNICVKMTIPNAPEYRQALRGVLADLGKYWTWRQTIGQSSDDALEAAELWRAATQTIVYTDECGGEMSCADVADCIENDVAARAAVAGVAGTASQPGTTATPGERLPDSKWSANLTPSDDCDLDAFWAQCVAFVDYTVTAGIDFLETLETYSNAVEASAFIELAPVIGTIMDEAQIDQVIAFIDWCLEVVQEAFVSADTQPNRLAIACALFCAGKADCELTLESAFEAINGRLGGVLSPSDLDSTQALITAAVTIATNPAFPLDTWLAIVIALGRTMSYLGIQGVNQSLNLMLLVAAGNPSGDWMLLCTDCPPDPEECAGAAISYDFRLSNGGYSETVAGYAIYEAGQGWGYGSFGFVIGIDKVVAGSFQRVKLYMSFEEAGTLFLRNNYASGWASYSYTVNSTGMEGGLYYYDINVDTPITDGMSVQYFTSSDAQHIVRMCLFTDPL